ncbi:MAG: hypothetical protein FJ261_11340 [Planctomycetes bacterium]|nr:hypothetical protein [Planctomycetota bacterium]
MNIRTTASGPILGALLVILAIVGLSDAAHAADIKEASQGTGTSWGEYMTVGKLLAEVRSADGDSIRMRVYWNTVTQGKTGAANRGGRPSLHGNHGRTAQSPLALAKAAMAKSKSVQVKTEHHDYDVGFFPDTVVRGAPKTLGGATTLAGDLSAGTIVEAWLVRKKSFPTREVQESDLKLKAVAVVWFNPNYKADNEDNQAKPAPAKSAK